MKRPIIILVFAFLLCFRAGYGQDYSGHYVLQSTMGSIEMILETGPEQTVTGTLIDGTRSFEVEGRIRNKWLTGTVHGGGASYSFQAIRMGDRLSFTLSETAPGSAGQGGNTQTLTFERSSMPQGSMAGASTDRVVINNKVLTEAQLSAFQNQYGARPLPGHYWYDNTSGLYGVVGYPAYGFMRPGHDFGPLQVDASNGHSGVFINGRQLPQLEWAIWSYMLGYWIQPGRYWLDENGNAGYEGQPAPLVNLYAVARQNAYNGRGGSGDNFWSTRFSAGNSNAANTQGYVSVPGYGPVGYGF